MGIFQDLALTLPPIRRLRESRNAHATRAAELESRLNELERELGAVNSGRGHVLFHYHASFDADAIMHRHAVADLQPAPGLCTNFLGVRIDPKFYPPILDGMVGQVEGIPIPANWHADMAEWAGALRAVELAKDRFTVMELGCGWGCWMNNSGVAARRMGLKPHLIGIEGDEGHIAFAKEACAANGFSEAEIELHRGIAGAHSGVALFPKQAQAGGSWGLEAVFNPSKAQLAEARKAGGYDELPIVALETAAAGHARIDLLHIDIQGAEADLIEACLPFLAEKVAYILIGTHSREIEGRLFAALRGAGWLLEMERAAILRLVEGAPVTFIDGVQGWRNPRLAAA